MSKRKLSWVLSSCLAVGACSGAAFFSAPVSAEDAPRDDMMMKDQMMKDHVMRMKEAMKDPASMKAMQDQDMRMMAMEHMAHQMAMDPKFQQMHDEMMKDPAMMKMMQDQKMMMADKDAMMKMHEQIMKDPHMMDLVMQKAMMMDMMMRDPDMKKMMMDKKMSEK